MKKEELSNLLTRSMQSLRKHTVSNYNEYGSNELFLPLKIKLLQSASAKADGILLAYHVGRNHMFECEDFLREYGAFKSMIDKKLSEIEFS